VNLVAARFGLCSNHAGDGFYRIRRLILQRNLASVTASRLGFTTIIPRIGSWLSVPSSSNAVPLKCWPCVKI